MNDATDIPAAGPATPAPVPPAELAPQTRWLRTPPIDIFDTGDGLVLRADLPGVTSESLELQVQDNRLTLFGRAQLDLPEEERLVHQEYHVGDFLRSFILSDDVDHERIAAKLNDGVLELTLPRAPKAKPRKIEVKTE
jgi:HSP20 family protein